MLTIPSLFPVWLFMITFSPIYVFISLDPCIAHLMDDSPYISRSISFNRFIFVSTAMMISLFVWPTFEITSVSSSMKLLQLSNISLEGLYTFPSIMFFDNPLWIIKIVDYQNLQIDLPSTLIAFVYWQHSCRTMTSFMSRLWQHPWREKLSGGTLTTFIEALLQTSWRDTDSIHGGTLIAFLKGHWQHSWRDTDSIHGGKLTAFMEAHW